MKRLEEEPERRVASRSSLATSVCSTSSTSSASSTESVAYRGIDVETVSDVCDVQSYAKSRVLLTIQSESESDVEPNDVPVASEGFRSERAPATSPNSSIAAAVS